MRLGLILAFLLKASLAFSMSCEGLLSPEAFSANSLKTNSDSVFDPATLKGKSPSTDHLEAYVEPLRGVLLESIRVFNDPDKFYEHFLTEYGLKNSDFFLRPRLKKKIESFRAQQQELLNVIMRQLLQRHNNKTIVYNWVVMTSVRITKLVDIFPLTGMDNSGFIKNADKKAYKINLLKNMFADRLLSAEELKYWENRFSEEDNHINADETDAAYAAESIKYFPQHAILPYVGSLSAFDIGNAVVQGVHYINIVSSQTQAHKTFFYQPRMFAFHDWAHLKSIAEATEQSLDRLNTWSLVERNLEQLRGYVKHGGVSDEEIREVQRMLYFLIHEVPMYLEFFSGAISNGSMAEEKLNNYLEELQKDFQNLDVNAHRAAIQNYFTWLSESGSAQRF